MNKKSILITTLIIVVSLAFVTAVYAVASKKVDIFSSDKPNKDVLQYWIDQNKNSSNEVDQAIAKYLENRNQQLDATSDYTSFFALDEAYNTYILGLDMKHLPAMIKKIGNNDQNSYILSFAVSRKLRVSKLNSIVDEGPGSNGKWTSEYKKIAASAPDKVKEISKKYKDIKNKGTKAKIESNDKSEIIRLGYLALPYLLDEIANGEYYFNEVLEDYAQMSNDNSALYADVTDTVELKLDIPENTAIKEAKEEQKVVDKENKIEEKTISVSDFTKKNKDKVDVVRVLVDDAKAK